MNFFPPALDQTEESRVIDLEHTIRWLPISDPFYRPPSMLSASRTSPLVVHQQVFSELDAQCVGPDTVGMGILIGGHYRCPNTKFEYALIEHAVAVAKDGQPNELTILTARLSAMMPEAKAQGKCVMGWYFHGAEVEPRIGRIEAQLHRTLCSEPWQVVLLSESGQSAEVGAFVRVEPAELRAFPIPFYELFADGKDGRPPQTPQRPRRTSVRWKNYHADVPVQRSPSTNPLPSNSPAANDRSSTGWGTNEGVGGGSSVEGGSLKTGWSQNSSLDHATPKSASQKNGAFESAHAGEPDVDSPASDEEPALQMLPFFPIIIVPSDGENMGPRPLRAFFIIACALLAVVAFAVLVNMVLGHR